MPATEEYSNVAPPLALQEDVTVFVPTEGATKPLPKNVNPDMLAKARELSARGKQLGDSVRKKVEKPKQASKPKVPPQPKLKETNSDTVQKIKRYLNPNPQLRDVPQGRLGEKTPGELEIEEALAQGDYERATALSDKFQMHESASQVLNAISCVKYSECKKEEERILRQTKKPRLAWTFDSKANWERKGNM